MDKLIAVMFWVWVAWCLGLWFVMLVMPYFCHHNIQGIFTNGITIFNKHLLWQLPADEQVALLLHEQGHIRKLHTFKGLLRLWLFIWPSEAYIRKQELEADDYVVQQGHGMALARALRRGAVDEFDLRRATRLEMKCFNPFTTERP